MRTLLSLLLDLCAGIFYTIKRLFLKLLEIFLEINILEKGIVLSTVLAFAAVVAPMARYKIFDMYFSINNPAAHYLIGIVLIMLVTI